MKRNEKQKKVAVFGIIKWIGRDKEKGNVKETIVVQQEWIKLRWFGLV